MILLSRNHSTSNGWQAFLLPAAVCGAVSTLTAAATVVLNRGFGTGDLLPFLLWTLLFAAVIGFIKEKLTDLLPRFSVPLKYAVAAIIGMAGGVLWTYIVAFFLGVWFGAFSFPVLPYWMAGGASGMITGTVNDKSRRRSALVDLTLITALCLGSIVIPKYLVNSLSNNQRLEVVSVRWKPSTQPLTIQEASSHDIPDDFKLSNQDLVKLKALGLTGQAAFDGSSGFVGRGKHARALIVMQRPLTEGIELPQPDGVEVIYIQGEDGWKIYPSNAPTLQRTIRLWPDERDQTWATLYSIERADGSRQGGTLFTW